MDLQDRLDTLPTIRRGKARRYHEYTRPSVIPGHVVKVHEAGFTVVERPAWVWPDGFELPMALISDPSKHPLIDIVD